MLEGGDTEETVGKVQVGSPDGTTMSKALECDAEAEAFAIASPVCPPESTDQSLAYDAVREHKPLGVSGHQEAHELRGDMVGVGKDHIPSSLGTLPPSQSRSSTHPALPNHRCV